VPAKACGALLTRTLAGCDRNGRLSTSPKDAEQRSYKPMVGVATRVATERLLSRIPVLALVGENLSICYIQFELRIGGGATGTIRPPTSPRMPGSGFEGGHVNVHGIRWATLSVRRVFGLKAQRTRMSTVIHRRPTAMQSVVPSAD
jgi:hypothetical protein